MKSLLIWPGEVGKQKALNVVPSGHEALQQVRVEQARDKYGDVPMAWMDHMTMNLEPIGASK